MRPGDACKNNCGRLIIRYPSGTVGCMDCGIEVDDPYWDHDDEIQQDPDDPEHITTGMMHENLRIPGLR